MNPPQRIHPYTARARSRLRLRSLCICVSTLLLLATSIAVTTPAAQAISTRDQTRVDKVTEVVHALEAWAAVDGDFVVDGAGNGGNGRGWFQQQNDSYPVSIASVLVDAGFLRGGSELPVDPSDLNLTRHSVYDFIVTPCADRVAVWARTKYERPSTADQQWWTANECPTMNHKYFMLSAPLADVQSTHDQQRIEIVDEVVAGLESLARETDSFTIAGTGYQDRGLGWFSQFGTRNYDRSIANALAEGGHLVGIPADPMHHYTDGSWSSFDLRVYPCAGRAAVFARSHGTISTSVEDQAWWDANAEDQTNNIKWWAENKCPVIDDPADRTYFKLTAPLDDLSEPTPDDPGVTDPENLNSNLLKGAPYVCTMLLAGVPILDPGGFQREYNEPRRDVRIGHGVGGYAQPTPQAPDGFPMAYLWVPNGYYHVASGSISVPHGNYGAGVGPFTLKHYFDHGEKDWSFESNGPNAWTSDWRTGHHPSGRFLPVAASIVDVIRGEDEVFWSGWTDIRPISANPEPPAPVPCTVRLAMEEAFWSPSVFHLGADLALQIEAAIKAAVGQWISIASAVVNQIIPLGCDSFANGDQSAGAVSECLDSLAKVTKVPDDLRCVADAISASSNEIPDTCGALISDATGIDGDWISCGLDISKNAENGTKSIPNSCYDAVANALGSPIQPSCFIGDVTPAKKLDCLVSGLMMIALPGGGSSIVGFYVGKIKPALVEAYEQGVTPPTTAPDGSTISVIPNTTTIVVVDAEGNEAIVHDDRINCEHSCTVTNNSDGSQTVVSTDSRGNSVSVTTHTDLSTTVVVTTSDSAGTTIITEQADGTIVTEYPNGAIATQALDGTIVTVYLDGTVTTELIDGTVITEYPDGTSDTVSPDGLLEPK